jgi:hypothetical protein
VYGLAHNIELADIQIPERCPLLGIELDLYAKPMANGLPSLDRIDPDKGYVRGNVQIISWRANRLKNNATIEEMRLMTAGMERVYASTKAGALTLAQLVELEAMRNPNCRFAYRNALCSRGVRGCDAEHCFCGKSGIARCVECRQTICETCAVYGCMSCHPIKPDWYEQVVYGLEEPYADEAAE